MVSGGNIRQVAQVPGSGTKSSQAAGDGGGLGQETPQRSGGEDNGEPEAPVSEGGGVGVEAGQWARLPPGGWACPAGQKGLGAP